MEFREELEMQVIRKIVTHAYGPCLMCDGETKYGPRVARFGKAWVQKHFLPKARKRYLQSVRTAVPLKDRSVAMLEELLCATCQAGLYRMRQESAAERNALLRRRQFLRERWRGSADPLQMVL